MKRNSIDFDKLNSESAKKTYKRVYETIYLIYKDKSESFIKNSELSANSKNAYLNALNWIYLQLGKEDKIAKLIRADVVTKKLPLTKNQIKKALTFLTYDEQVLFRLLIETGMRSEEVNLITKVNEEDGTFLIQGAKGNKDRYVPLPQWREVVGLIKRLQEGKAISYKIIYTMTKKVSKHIHMDVTPHTLRYTFATTQMYENGVPIEVISEIMGHSSLDQTMDYIRLSHKNIRVHFQKQYFKDSELLEEMSKDELLEFYKNNYAKALITIKELEKNV